MKKLLIFALFASLTFLYVGCDSSDDNGTTPPPPQDPIVGTWISEGSDVAPGLVATLKQFA